MSAPLLQAPDQMAFAAPSGPRPGGNRPFTGGNRLYRQHCRQPGHTVDRCFDLHPELKQQFFRSKSIGRGKGAPRTGVVVEVAPPTSDYGRIQSQIAQLQSHLG